MGGGDGGPVGREESEALRGGMAAYAVLRAGMGDPADPAVAAEARAAVECVITQVKETTRADFDQRPAALKQKRTYQQSSTYGQRFHPDKYKWE